GAWKSKNMNVRDLTRLERSRSGLMMHPTLYDVKGIGGGSLVGGAGSVRDNGEVYKCIDDSPVAEVPDWLIDWLLADLRKYRSGRDKELAEKNQKKVVALRLKAEVRSNLRRQ